MKPWVLIQVRRRRFVATAVFMTVLACLLVNFVALGLHAQPISPGQTMPSSIRILLLSPSRVEGLTGQFVTVTAAVENQGANATSGVAYISIVDTNSSLPIDLEDWSAQKGFYISSIPSGQSLQLEWSIRLVKAGSYTVTVLYATEGDLTPPTSSPRISLQVLPKLNLNPNNVLPVAFGVPLALIAAFALLNYCRGKKTEIYQ